jgi:hypothetical protein
MELAARLPNVLNPGKRGWRSADRLQILLTLRPDYYRVRATSHRQTYVAGSMRIPRAIFEVSR